jgi:glycosyltransferase involved in cell wall biosynthesis
MRLVIDGRRLGRERTGVGRYLEILLHEWSRTGLPLEPTIVVLKDPAARAAIPNCSTIERVVVGTNWPGLAWECWGLGQILRPDDLLFAPTNLVPPNWRGRTALVLFDALQEVLPKTFSRWARWRFGLRYRLAAQRADRVIVPSQSTASDVARIYGVPADRLRVIYPAPDHGFRLYDPGSEIVRQARQTAGVESNPFFLFVGKRSQRRNIPAIVQAFRRVHEQRPDHRLLFVGPDASGIDGQPLRAERGITVAGHVTDEVLQGLMASATALLYPSDYEGFGLPIVEALASGCPVITLRNSALIEAGGEAAWYLDAADPRALADTMLRVMLDDTERNKRVRLGLNHAANLRPARFAERVKHELVSLAAEGLRPARSVTLRAG